MKNIIIPVLGILLFGCQKETLVAPDTTNSTQGISRVEKTQVSSGAEYVDLIIEGRDFDLFSNDPNREKVFLFWDEMEDLGAFDPIGGSIVMVYLTTTPIGLGGGWEPLPLDAFPDSPYYCKFTYKFEPGQGVIGIFARENFTANGAQLPYNADSKLRFRIVVFNASPASIPAELDLHNYEDVSDYFGLEDKMN